MNRTTVAVLSLYVKIAMGIAIATTVVFGFGEAFGALVLLFESMWLVATTAFGQFLYPVLTLIGLGVLLLAADVAAHTILSESRFPTRTVGVRYIEDEERADVEMCINCNRGGSGVETTARRIFVFAGFPVWTYDSVTVEECDACAEADEIDYALRRTKAPSVVEAVHGEDGTRTTVDGGAGVASVGHEYRCRRCSNSEYHEDDDVDDPRCPQCGFEMNHRVRTHRDPESLSMKLLRAMNK